MALDKITATLTRTPGTLDALLTDAAPDWVHRNDGPGTWSAYDIVGHLLECESANWLTRARTILEHGTGQTFEPFDREAMLKREPEPVNTLLARFRTARLASLRELTDLGLRVDDFERVGAHPEFGTVTLGQLLSTWAAHDLTHVGQVAEVLARRYRDAVGPYRAYLPALDRTAEAE
jgi:uncharacterized damage-inducible protein DinB